MFYIWRPTKEELLRITVILATKKRKHSAKVATIIQERREKVYQREAEALRFIAEMEIQRQTQGRSAKKHRDAIRKARRILERRRKK